MEIRENNTMINEHFELKVRAVFFFPVSRSFEKGEKFRKQVFKCSIYSFFILMAYYADEHWIILWLLFRFL